MYYFIVSSIFASLNRLLQEWRKNDVDDVTWDAIKNKYSQLIDHQRQKMNVADLIVLGTYWDWVNLIPSDDVELKVKMSVGFCRYLTSPLQYFFIVKGNLVNGGFDIGHLVGTPGVCEKAARKYLADLT